MAKTIKTKTITLSEKEGTFSTIFNRFTGQKGINSEISDLRHILSNEKARLLHVIKTKQPASIYGLAKLLGRDFKAVRQDIRLLEEFGFLELVTSNKNGRELLRPIVSIDKLVITLNL